jgi:hypothetical protein
MADRARHRVRKTPRRATTRYANPSVEVVQILADGTDIKAVWSHVIPVDVAKLVTVHFFDE